MGELSTMWLQNSSFEVHGIFLTEKFLILAPVALWNTSKELFFRPIFNKHNFAKKKPDSPVKGISGWLFGSVVI